MITKAGSRMPCGGGADVAALRAVAHPGASFAGEPQGQAPSAFEPAQPGRFAWDIVAGHRYDALPFCQLDLEHHQSLLAESHLGSGQIELPNPHEALAVDRLD